MTYTNKCNSLEELLEAQDREFVNFKGLNAIEQARAQAQAALTYARDSWAFLRDCVFTLDQVSQESPIKVFPSYLRYVEFLVKLWQRERLMAVPKSRRMFCSWTFISLFTHDTLFHEGRYNALVSKKEDDSGELIGRGEFIYNKIPEWRLPRALLPRLKNGRMSKQPPLMEFEDTHSKMQGFPQGSDQMRQFTFSGMLFDEWAFWDQAQPSYSAAKPTIDGGGRLTGISSRSPGFFKKIVFDQLDSPDLTFREVPPVEPKSPLEGVEVWKNPLNGFCVVDLHYTADPRKRSDDWRETIRKSMPARDFAMEYERSWQTFEGKPVYIDWNSKLHLGTKLDVEPGIPLLLGWDFGLTPACLIGQLVGRRLRILKEFVESDGSISKLGPVVWNYLMVNYLNWMHTQRESIISYIDPAGFERKDTDEKTCADVLRYCGEIKRPDKRIGFQSIRPGPVRWEPRRQAVEKFLTATYGDGPGLLVDSDECPILVEGFNGGYRYPEKAIEVEPQDIRPIKNKYSHPHDALQYLADGATALARSYGIRIDIPVPNYGFQSPGIKLPKEKPYGI